MGKGEHDLSEMFFVRYAYLQKAEDFIRFHGKTNFSQGGQAHDVTNVLRQFGIVPESAYPGLEYGSQIHDHTELSNVLEGIVKAVLKSKKSITPNWNSGYQALLDSYLGTPPQKFEYQGEKYSPEMFAQNLGLRAENYIELTSFAHQPYYKPFDLEVPDNWSHDLYYNLPIDQLLEVMKHALENNYSIVWDGDVGNDNFSFSEGTATTAHEAEDVEITQDMRQESFNLFNTTDDHLMHLTGLAKNKDGTLFFLTKNSWGAKSNSYDGYLYMSESYIRLHTVAIMVHKDALPKDIARQIGVK